MIKEIPSSIRENIEPIIHEEIDDQKNYPLSPSTAQNPIRLFEWLSYTPEFKKLIRQAVGGRDDLPQGLNVEPLKRTDLEGGLYQIAAEYAYPLEVWLKNPGNEVVLSPNRTKQVIDLITDQELEVAHNSIEILDAFRNAYNPDAFRFNTNAGLLAVCEYTVTNPLKFYNYFTFKQLRLDSAKERIPEVYEDVPMDFVIPNLNEDIRKKLPIFSGSSFKFVRFSRDEFDDWVEAVCVDYRLNSHSNTLYETFPEIFSKYRPTNHRSKRIKYRPTFSFQS
jgi:hypothetical protein